MQLSHGHQVVCLEGITQFVLTHPKINFQNFIFADSVNIPTVWGLNSYPLQ